MGKNIGFVSTRFTGAEEISSEAGKWAQVLSQNGYRCYWFAGESDRNPDKSYVVQEAHSATPENMWINKQIYGKKSRNRDVSGKIHLLRALLKSRLHDFIKKFDIDLLVAENVFAVPVHLPLGLALAEVVAELQIPTIAHHHEFYWTLTRFAVNAVGDYLQMAFPPNLPNIQHVVLNTGDQEELARRTGISAIVIPNVLDFVNPPKIDEAQGKRVLDRLGFVPGDIMILQPTSILQHKGIDSAIELVKGLKDPRYKLVISEEIGEQDLEYAAWLKNHAAEHRVDLVIIPTRAADPWTSRIPDQRLFTLWDIYPCADFITYPSLYEGFGNAFLEAIYFRKPMLVNRYATFIRDIEPMGFDLVIMDGFLTREKIRQVKEVLESHERRKAMVEHNYEVARRHFSYHVLKNRLNFIMMNFFGMPT